MKVLKRHIPLFVLLIGIPGLMYFCSSPTESFVKDPHDYTWTIDTIKNPDPTSIQTKLNSIWGSSSSNVYACGHTDAGPEIYHYDGVNWSAIDLRDYSLRNGVCNKVFGFSENDVWIAGGLGHGSVGNSYTNSYLIHNNGSTWESYEFEIRSELTDIWGTSSNNLWACGRDGLVIHYDGNVWEFDTVSIPQISEDFEFYPYSILEYNNHVYVVGYKFPGGGTYYFVKKIFNEWIVLDSVDSSTGHYRYGTTGLYLSEGNVLFSFGFEGLFQTIEDSSNKIIDVESSVTGMTEFNQGSFIVSEFRNNLYLLEDNGYEIIKQTGSNLIYFIEVWASSEECFVLSWDYGNDFGNTLVFHGK